MACLISTAAVVTVSATPAHAAWSNCPSGNIICIFDNPDGYGAMYTIGVTPGCWNLSNFNDRAGSVYNKSGKTITLYEHANCTSSNGWATNLPHGWKITFGFWIGMS